MSFTERNISTDADARDELIRMGFRAIPVIKVGDETMVGFNPPKLRQLLKLQ